jgi:hypothetical protein
MFEDIIHPDSTEEKMPFIHGTLRPEGSEIVVTPKLIKKLVDQLSSVNLKEDKIIDLVDEVKHAIWHDEQNKPLPPAKAGSCRLFNDGKPGW